MLERRRNARTSRMVPVAGIALSTFGLICWWRYYLHLDHIEGEHAWACTPGTYVNSPPSYCTGIYNPGIKHDLIYGSFFALIILLVACFIFALVNYFIRNNASKDT